MKITVSYSEDQEDFLRAVMERLKPFLPFFKVKKSTAKGKYTRLYFTLRNDSENAK